MLEKAFEDILASVISSFIYILRIHSKAAQMFSSISFECEQWLEFVVLLCDTPAEWILCFSLFFCTKMLVNVKVSVIWDAWTDNIIIWMCLNMQGWETN